MNKKDIDCIHFKNCSGCSIQSNVNNPPLLEEAKNFFKENNFSQCTIHTGNNSNWRCRAKLAVRGSWQEPQIGLYRAHSHDVVPIPHCQIHHPKINEAVSYLKKWMQQEKIAPYNEKSTKGLIRYVQCVVERATNTVQISLVFNANSTKADYKKLVESLWNQAKHLWHSIWINCNTRQDNVIFDAEWHHIFGQSLLWERICGVDICFQPANFAQANLDLFENMIESVKDSIPENAKVCELYAGVGTIGLAVAEKCSEISCSDINSAGLFCFEQSQKKMPQEIAKRISWRQGDASMLSKELVGKDTLIVDPPRSGITKELKQSISQAYSLTTLIYISCGWKSFARDTTDLLQDGWQLLKGEIYILFPGSNHIETVAVFKKQ